MAPAPCSDSLMKAVEAELAADVAHAVAAALDLGELKEDALSDCLSLSRVAHHHTRHFRLPAMSCGTAAATQQQTRPGGIIPRLRHVLAVQKTGMSTRYRIDHET